MKYSTAPDILCVGASLWDLIGRSLGVMPLGADVPGRIVRQPGGVAMNIAMTLRRLGLTPALLTAIGTDAEGEDLTAACRTLGIRVEYANRSTELPTGCYIAVEDANGLVAAIADTRVLEAAGDKILLALADGRLGQPDRPWSGLIAIDGNLTAGLLAEIAASPLFAAADLRVASASAGKVDRLLPLLTHPRVTLYVNLAEAARLCSANFSDAAEAARGLLARGAARVLVTDGERDCADAMAGTVILTARPPQVTVRRVTGAGDTFLAAHLAAEVRGAPRAAALDAALHAASEYVAGTALS